MLESLPVGAPLQARVERLAEGGSPQVSFEFFPPRDAAAETRLWREIVRLEALEPRFVSVTYGAGGSTRERTHRIVSRIRNESLLEPAAHLTCVGAAREEIQEIARSYWTAGVRHIVALRGDPPREAGPYEPHPGGYPFAVDLVAGLKEVADFEISVAAYPEVHPQASGAEADLDNLKAKLDAGASRAITQFFFDPLRYLRFLERARAAGIGAPIVPGILPITNIERTIQIARNCGAGVPDWLRGLFDSLDDDPHARALVAAVAGAELCRQLQAHGVEEFHFYTLNRAELTLAICRLLNTPLPSTSGLAAVGAA